MIFCYKLLSTAFSILTVLTLTHSSTLARLETNQTEFTQLRLCKFGYFDINIGPAIKYSKFAPDELRLGYDANVSVEFGF